MKILDISWPIDLDITGYKNKKELEIIDTKVFSQDKVRESKITIGSHAGTHVDAPSHMISNGHTVDQINLNTLVGPAKVLDLTEVTDFIDKKSLKKFKIKPNSIVLFKTKNSELDYNSDFNPKFIYLNKEGAEYLVDLKVKAVGIDYLGIERNQPNRETHKLLFDNNISLIEGLRLKNVNSGSYFFICLPLKLLNIDAAPARAILIC